MGAAGLLLVLRRRLLPLLVCVLAGAIGGLALTRATSTVYSSTSTVFVNIPESNSISNSAASLTLVADLLPSYVTIAESRNVASKVQAELVAHGEPSLSVGYLQSHIQAKALASKLILQITGTGSSPRQAEAIANGTTQALADAVAELQKDQVKSTTVELQIIDPGTKGRQTLPRPTYNLAIGLVLGLAVGLLLALVLDALDRSVKTASQTEASTRSPVLGIIPRRRDATGVVSATDSSAEAYRMLRTGVTFANPDNPVRVVMITSPSANEGKTSTAVNLAVALAQSGERTVLVDADLRRGRVAAALGLEASVGVTSVITRSVDVGEALQTGQDGLRVLATGQLPPNPSEMVGSQAMVKLLQDLSAHADVIVIDAPPVLAVTDAVVLSTQVEGVVLVVRAGRTQRSQASEARRRLDAVNAQVLGSVLNGVKRATVSDYGIGGHLPLS